MVHQCSPCLTSSLGIGRYPWLSPAKRRLLLSATGVFYQSKRMPFGLMNAPAKFQRFMNKILAQFIGKFCFVYSDNIVVFSRTQAEHEEHLRKVFTVLQEHNLKLKASKSHLQLPEIKLLVYLINKDGKRSDPEKIEALMNMAQPSTVNQVRSFLGLTGYYRTLIPNYAKIAAPLTQLLLKTCPFSWGNEQEEAWTRLRDELVSDRIMAYPDPSRP